MGISLTRKWSGKNSMETLLELVKLETNYKLLWIVGTYLISRKIKELELIEKIPELKKFRKMN